MSRTLVVGYRDLHVVEIELNGVRLLEETDRGRVYLTRLDLDLLEVRHEAVLLESDDLVALVEVGLNFPSGPVMAIISSPSEISTFEMGKTDTADLVSGLGLAT
jgi:hypothetical protein